MIPKNDAYNLNRRQRRFKVGVKTDSQDVKFTRKGAHHHIDNYTKSAAEAKRLRRSARKDARTALKDIDE